MFDLTDREAKFFTWFVIAIVIALIFLLVSIAITATMNVNPKKDVYGQDCRKQALFSEWTCPSDTQEYKELKANGCKITTVSKTGTFFNLVQYEYTCKTGKKYILDYEYKGL